MPVLRAEGLHKRYGEGDSAVDAVRGVGLELAGGEFVAVVGPSGCGKSTLLHLCGGMDRPTAGSVAVDGVDLAGLDDEALTGLRRARVGFVFQFFNLLPTLTLAENVALPARRQRLTRETGGAVLLATHDPVLAAAADRRIRMRDGAEVREPAADRLPTVALET